MFFNIDADSGHSISGWLAPDNPSSVPKLVVVVPGRPDIVIEANVDRPDIKELGLHATGRVGFLVNELMVPGLARLQDIAILDADTRITVHRRFKPEQHIERKLFFFDPSAMPQRGLWDDLSSRFSLAYTNCERHSLETMIVLINNHFSKSIFSGRSQFSRYASFLESGNYLRVAMLRHPVQELAERLMFLGLVARSDASHMLGPYTTGLAPLVDLARGLNFRDPKAILGSFRQIDDAQKEALMSSMVRMLGCTLDEPITHNSVSLALDHLATLDIVGTRARFPIFRALLQQFLGVEVLKEEEPALYPSVTEFAEILSRIGIVMDLLEHDLALYGYVEEALGSSVNGEHMLPKRDVHSI